MIKQEIFNIPNNKEALFKEYKDTIDTLKDKAQKKEDFYKVIRPEHRTNLVHDLMPIAREIRDNFSELLVVSIGGASLNPMALLNAIDINSGIEVNFISSTEPWLLRKQLACIKPLQTAVLTISKSGDTLETISILGAIINSYEAAGVVGNNLKKYFYFISNEYSRIGAIANQLGSKLISHDQAIGGRYSGFSAVSVLPLLIKGGDADQYIQGANEELQKFHDEKFHDALYFALIANNLRKSSIVNVIYESRLNVFLDWYAQIIAESLGKAHKGFTPICSQGPQDQHSMFQLYLEGPDDKLYTYYRIKNNIGGQYHIPIWQGYSSMGNLSGVDINIVHKANEEASFSALRSINRPIRTVTLDRINEKIFGALVAFSMIETIALGAINDINPFNQDGVELIKARTNLLMPICDQ